MTPCPTCGALPCDQVDKTPMEAVAWRIRPKGALGDVMGFQIVTDKYTAQDYAEQPAFEVQALAVIPTEWGGQSSGNTGELNTEGKTNDRP